MAKKVLLIDAFAVIHRAFHALPDFTAPDGTHVNVVYDFFSTLLKAVRDVQPDYLVVAFDLAGPTIRHQAFAEYKAQRPETPSVMAEQIPLVKELVSAIGLPILAREGYEAEDVIATVIDKTKEQDFTYVIVTGDQDTLQLAAPNVKIYFLRRGLSDVALVDDKEVERIYGVTPAQIIEVKALKGDSSDNVPGVPGIGDKSAVELVKQFGTIKHLFAKLSDAPAKYKKLLEGKQEQASLARELVTIRHDAPLDVELGQFVWSEDHLQKALPLLERFHMTSLIKRITQPKAESSVKKSSVKQESLL